MAESETISAIATPPGFGGVGIVRISGPHTTSIAQGVLGSVPAPRVATLSEFLAASGDPMDQGIALFYRAPRSFTGEDVLELQGHGGPVVMDMLLRRTLELGARLARPGEFSERAFLNGKLDLAQAEAVADLVESRTDAAARLAVRTMEGAFSRRIGELVETLIRLRTIVEAAMDFPDEEIDPLAQEDVLEQLGALCEQTAAVIATARQGRIVREGLRIVIAGPTNAGKSSILNRLSGTDAAIVTEVPGTTRDVLRQEIQLDGMPLHVIDTAGFRDAADKVEQEGIRRARAEIGRADRVLWVFDGRDDPGHAAFNAALLPEGVGVTFVRNKIDLTGTPPGERVAGATLEIAVSARTGAGLDALQDHLKRTAGYRGPAEGEFLARRRHLDALDRALTHMRQAYEVTRHTGGPELLAEDLRQAQGALGEITGAFSSEDLLGRIFSSFCIGK